MPTPEPMLSLPGLSRLDYRTLIDVAPNTPTEMLDALETYFRRFAQPAFHLTADGIKFEHIVCPGCGSRLTGSLLDGFIGRATFQWGLAHGEGACSECGYPARAYHEPADAHGDMLIGLSLVLAYHPDELAKKEADHAND